jgi:iduronate 2-sulfatase
MDTFYWDVYDEIYDKEARFFYRDKRFIEPRSVNGKKVFWSRGNGWVMGGLPLILEYLPKDHKTYPRYVELFKQMSAALAACQGEDGLWRPNLADAKEFPMPETSGTGFFVYAMAWGINNKILDMDTYLPVVQKAWAGLVRSVDAEGKVQWGQLVGDRPVSVKKQHSHEYVTATFLLAGSEMLKIAQHTSQTEYEAIGMFPEKLKNLKVLTNGKKEKKAETTGKPNVLFIAIDDLRTELGCYGASHIKSPNIDKLATQGVQFNQAFVQQAICMASRASIMSGIRPARHKIFTGESLSELIPDALTINKLFKQNGYNIASCGKIYHHGIDTEKQFGDDYMKPNKTWTGRGYVTPEAIEKIKLNEKFKRGPAYECADVHDTIYKDGINTLNAVRKLEELSKDDKPFFLAVGLSKPHLPFVAPKKYWDMYPESSITMPEVRGMPENSNKYTMRIRGELNNYYGIPQLYADIDDSTILTLRRGYYACVSYADAQVGHLLNQLEKLGLSENTIIILWGDHGYKLGDYGNWCKWSNMNLDTHVPLIVKAPGFKKGEQSDALVELVDMYPTLSELCDLELPKHLEGTSFVPLLKEPDLEWKEAVFTLWPHYRSNYDKTITGFSVKTQRYNYVEWTRLKTGEVLERELYDRQLDPKETINVINNAEYKEDIKTLEQMLKDGWKSAVPSKNVEQLSITNTIIETG